MAMSMPQGLARHHRLVTRVMMALLFTIVAAESFLLYQQRAAHRAIETQSAKLLTTFLQADTAEVSRAQGVSIRLQNVRFKWSDKVYVDAANMAVRAEPIQGNVVKFDDPGSFVLSLQQSVVQIRPEVLEGMMNESIFNYPGSKVRDLKVAIVRDGDSYPIELTGKIKMLVWITFKMGAHLSVDQKTNTLVMNADKLKVLGFIPATKIVEMGPFHLEKLMTLPPNNSLIVAGNRIMVKPFGLFPPPRVNGTIAAVSTDAQGIRLTFAGQPIHAPKSSARNYVYLRGGIAQFGNFRTVDTDVLIVDRNQDNPFMFSILHYNELIPRSNIEVHNTKSVLVDMPDS
jgi:hypothetical protein